MNWTVEQKRLATTIVKRMGSRVSVSALTYFLKRHLDINPSSSEVAALLTEIMPAPPQAVFKPLVKSPPRSAKDSCLQTINDLKAEVEARGVRSVQVELTDEGISPILCLSDLHFGEIIEVNDTVIFDMDIAEASFDSVIDQAISSRELMSYNVDEFVVLLAGDIVDGELIYPAQSFDTDGNVYSQMKRAHTVIWNGLVRLADAFGAVKVYCVAGNHGRSSKLHSQMSNWDNVLYWALQLTASVQTTHKIQVHTPHQMWMDFSVRNWNVHTRHIGVTQAATSSPAKRVMTWMQQHNADLFFYGHFHNPEMYSHGYKRIFKNGSLPPANEFAERLGFLDSRGQWLVGVTKDNPVAFTKILIPQDFTDQP